MWEENCDSCFVCVCVLDRSSHLHKIVKINGWNYIQSFFAEIITQKWPRQHLPPRTGDQHLVKRTFSHVWPQPPPPRGRLDQTRALSTHTLGGYVIKTVYLCKQGGGVDESGAFTLFVHMWMYAFVVVCVYVHMRVWVICTGVCW